MVVDKLIQRDAPFTTWLSAMILDLFAGMGGACEKCRRCLVGWPNVPRLKISHRLFAARCVTAIIDRGRLLRRGYRPKPRLWLGCLRVAHDATDYWSARVTEPHIVVVLVPMISSPRLLRADRRTSFASLTSECAIVAIANGSAVGVAVML